MPDLKLDFKNLGSIHLLPLDSSVLFLPFGRPVAEYLQGTAGNQNGARILSRQGPMDFAPLIRFTLSTAGVMRTTGFGELERGGLVESGEPPAAADPRVADFLPMEPPELASPEGKPVKVAGAMAAEAPSVAKPRLNALPLRPRMTFGPPPAAKAKTAPAPAPPSAKPAASAAVKPSAPVVAMPVKPTPAPVQKPPIPVKAVAPSPAPPKPVTVIPPAPKASPTSIPAQRTTLPQTTPQTPSQTSAPAPSAPPARAPEAPKPATAPPPSATKITTAVPAARAPEAAPVTTVRPVAPAVPAQPPVQTPPPSKPAPAALKPSTATTTTVPKPPAPPVPAARSPQPVEPPKAAAPPRAAEAAKPATAPARPALVERKPEPTVEPSREASREPHIEPHLMGAEEPEGFFERIPMALKIGAGLLVVFLGLYMIFSKSSDKSSSDGAPITVGEQGWSTEWASDAAGSRRARQLTLYRPTVGMSDYQMGFVAQIESKAMGWVFHEVDTSNYYAMKIENLGPGKMAITHFAVVEGRESGYSQRALGVDSRPGAYYRVKVDVAGPRFTTYVGGEPVDFWTDNRLKAGAFGFMNERDERGAASSLQLSFPKGAK